MIMRWQVFKHILPILTLLTALLVLTLALPRPLERVLAIALQGQPAPARNVYSVRALYARLARDPRVWIGRTVRVHGVADYCLSWVSLGAGDAQEVCTSRQTVLRDPTATGAATALPLRFAPVSRLAAALWRLPCLAAWLPRAQVPWWGAPQTYVVRLERLASGTSLQATPSVAAVLLDADQTAL
jgi:hypothetical protein